MGTDPQMQSARILGLAATGFVYLGGVALSTYHGFHRHNESVGWGLSWGALATVLPVVTPAVAIGQGVGVPLRGSRRLRRCR